MQVETWFALLFRHTALQVWTWIGNVTQQEWTWLVLFEVSFDMFWIVIIKRGRRLKAFSVLLTIYSIFLRFSRSFIDSVDFLSIQSILQICVDSVNIDFVNFYPLCQFLSIL